jgi:MFS family permease
MGGGPARLLAPYASLFEERGTKGFVAAGFVSRLTGTMAIVALVLAITGHGGRYGLAGAVVAALTLATSVALPTFGRLIDRYGQYRVLVPMATAFGALMLLLMVGIAAGAPAWLLVILAAAAGVPMPVVGPFVRARWTKIYGGTDKLRVAYGFESATIEIVDIVGPIMVTALATGIGRMAGLGAVVACAVVGTLALAAQRSTEPEPTGVRRDKSTGTSALRVPALRSLYMMRFCTGGVFGSMPVATIAFATGHHARALSGLLLAVWGGTSMLAGLGYGALEERAPLHRRLAVSVALFAVGGLPLLVARDIPVLAGLLPLAGLAMAPATVSAMEVMQRVVPSSMLTETMSWDTTALAVGMTAGSFVTGQVAAHLGVDHVYVVPVGAGLLALVAVALGGRRIRAGCLTPLDQVGPPAAVGQPEGAR